MIKRTALILGLIIVLAAAGVTVWAAWPNGGQNYSDQVLLGRGPGFGGFGPGQGMGYGPGLYQDNPDNSSWWQKMIPGGRRIFGQGWFCPGWGWSRGR